MIRVNLLPHRAARRRRQQQQFFIALGMIAFGATFSARPDAAAGIIDEGCGGKAQWIIRGRDIRPRPSVSKAFDWENHRFEWEK